MQLELRHELRAAVLQRPAPETCRQRAPLRRLSVPSGADCPRAAPAGAGSGTPLPGQSGAPGVSSPALVKAAIAATAATSALMASQPRSSARVSANNTPKNG